MTTPDASGPSATLEAIKERNKVVNSSDVPRLVAALEAVLKLADDWDENARDLFGTDTEHSVTAAKAAQLREAITRALNGAPAPAIPAACPESKMDDGSHSDELDGGCAWCGASAAELEGRDA